MTGIDRRIVATAISNTLRALHDGRRVCGRCERWLPEEEFGERSPNCRTCESRRVADSIRRRKARQAA